MTDVTIGRQNPASNANSSVGASDETASIPSIAAVNVAAAKAAPPTTISVVGAPLLATAAAAPTTVAVAS